MDWWQVVVLAVIQGLTEFLPISSSAHLILPSKVLGWADQGLAFDVATHVGTLMAVMWYFRQRLIELTVGSFNALRLQDRTPESLLVFRVGIAVLPAAFVGCFFGDWIEANVRSVAVIIMTTAGFGLLLGVADSYGRGEKDLLSITWKVALLIGIAQAFALIPGTSRSGVTITAALLLGYSRQASAEFSFLLSIPIILAAGGLKGVELFMNSVQAHLWQMLLALLLSAVSAYICIGVFMRLLDRIGMWPFVWYRLGLAAVLGLLYF